MEPTPERLKTYARWRAAENRLARNADLVLNWPYVETCARKLGMWHKEGLDLARKQDEGVLTDYAVFVHRVGRKTRLEQFAEKPGVALDDDERIVLEAMLANKYSVYRVESITPKWGGWLWDGARNVRLFCPDRGMSSTLVPGDYMAVRLLPLPDFHITTSCPMAADEAIAALAKKELHGRTPEGLSPHGRSDWETAIIRACWRAGGNENVLLRNPDDPLWF